MIPLFLTNHLPADNNHSVESWSNGKNFLIDLILTPKVYCFMIRIIRLFKSIPLIMDSSSLMNGVEMSAYHDFSEDLIGAFKFYGRTIHGMNDEDVRLTSRLFLPQKRLRGFKMFDPRI